MNFGPIIIQVWGLFAALGFIAALEISLYEARRKYLNTEIIWNVMIIALLGMIVGSRLFYYLTSSETNAVKLFDPHGGFSLLGGAALAGMLSLAYLRTRKYDFRRVFDVLTPGIIVALIFVRMGCFFISDHIGRETALPWGAGFIDGSVRHPIALYHIFFLLFILFIIFRTKFKQRKNGALFFSFCFLYACLIFIADMFRCDDLSVCDKHFGNLTWTQWALLVFLILSPFTRHFFVSSKP